METLGSQDFKNILNIITIIDTYLGKDVFYQKLLDSLSKIFHMEKSVFFLPDENSKPTNLMGENIEEKYLREFKKYYYIYDPFKLVQGFFHGNRIIRLEDLVPYSSFLNSEYYNDFLRPQKIFYKTVAYLKYGRDLLGIVGFFRSKELGNFSEKDFKMIEILIPYLSQGLKNIELFGKIQLENSIFRMVDKNLSSGIIVFDDSMRLIHINSKAEDFCKFMSGMEYDAKHQKASYSKKYYLLIPYVVKEDCYRLKEQMKNGLNINPLPLYKIFKMSSFRKYSICSQVITKEMNPENQLFYMSKIDELIPYVTLDMKTLENDFNLSKREIEILENLFNGLKNTEIAEKLFITEITVKTHLQHIFEKTGVNSRTTLIRKIIEYQCLQPQGSSQL